MTVGVKSHFYICMAEATGNFHSVDVAVDEHRCVAVTKIVNADVVQVCCSIIQSSKIVDSNNDKSVNYLTSAKNEAHVGVK